MLAHIHRSWEYARISWAFQRKWRPLLVLPVLSGVLVLAIIGAFFGVLCPPRLLLAILGGGSDGGPFDRRPVYIGLLLAFFWCSFAIVFFNAAITAAVMGTGRRRGSDGASVSPDRREADAGARSVDGVVALARCDLQARGSDAREGFGIGRGVLRQQLVGVERLRRPLDARRWSRSDQGTPPVEADAEHDQAGGAIGTYSMGLLGFAVAAPVILVLLIVGAIAVARSSSTGLVLSLSLASATVALAAVITSAADAVLKAPLFNDATGHSLPAGIDRSRLREAFRSTDSSRLPLESAVIDAPGVGAMPRSTSTRSTRMPFTDRAKRRSSWPHFSAGPNAEERSSS